MKGSLRRGASTVWETAYCIQKSSISVQQIIPNQWLKIINTYYLMVSMGEGFLSGLAEGFQLKVSHQVAII